MSDAVSYVSEPATVGKVLVHTTLGDIDIELFSVQTPKACRSFVQHCLDGYYDGCLFHRVIKGFMAQTGDPSGTGLGGESAFGGEFDDEFHSRLKFTRRGLVGMASNGKNANRSQWFITLGAAEFLNKQHTLFGKLTGDTLFNIVRFNELEVENASSDKSQPDDEVVGRDRPLNPPKVLSTEVLVNPFDDLRPRVKEVKTKKDDRPKKKQKKNLKLLSFGEEESVEEIALAASAAALPSATGGSSHDLIDDARLSRRTLDEVAADQDRLNEDAVRTDQQRPTPADDARQSVRDALSKRKPTTGAADDEEFMDEAAFDAHMRQKLLQKKGIAAPAPTASDRTPDARKDNAENKDEEENTAEARKSRTAEYDRLKAEMGLSSKGPSSIKSHAIRGSSGPSVSDALLSPLEQRRARFKTRKENSHLVNREAETLAKLTAFKQTVAKAKEHAKPPPAFETVPAHSNVLIPPVPVREEADDDADWMSHQVRFTRRPQDFDHMARDVEGGSFAVLDPRGEEGRPRSSRPDKRGAGGSRATNAGHGGMAGVLLPSELDSAPARHLTLAEVESAEANQQVVDRLLAEMADGPTTTTRKRSRSRTPEQ